MPGRRSPRGGRTVDTARMAWPRAVIEIRAAVQLFMSRLDEGELSAAGASGLGHDFVVPAPGDPDFPSEDALVGELERPDGDDGDGPVADGV
jgi:hypothetical protein